MSKSTLVRKGNQAGDFASYDGTKWGPQTIHNYFPDGRITNDALIDTDNTYGPTKLIVGFFGDETLAFHTGGGVDVTLPAGYGRGVVIEALNAHGYPALAAGRYEFGFTLIPSGNAFLRMGVNPTASYDYAEARIVSPILTSRYLLRFNLRSAGGVQLTISTNVNDNPAIETPAQTELLIGGLMLTEGDGLAFADGDTTGWSWSGTANASSSSGPQPR